MKLLGCENCMPDQKKIPDKTVIVAIHQPNFFPWLGFFDKIQRSDVFVFLDHVQLPKTGGTWSNRVKVLVNGQAKWATAPIDRSFHGLRAINETRFQNGAPWRRSFVDLLARNYGKAPFYAETMEAVLPLVMNPENNVARYNADAVLGIAGALGIACDRFRWSSQLNIEGHSNEMLISLTGRVGGSAYLCGGGASTYQNDALFRESGFRLIYQNFVCSPYQQIHATSFVSGLSIIDALMNMGVQGVSSLLEVGMDRNTRS